MCVCVLSMFQAVNDKPTETFDDPATSPWLTKTIEQSEGNWEVPAGPVEIDENYPLKPFRKSAEPEEFWTSADLRTLKASRPTQHAEHSRRAPVPVPSLPCVQA